jgi:hypothetical protein
MGRHHADNWGSHIINHISEYILLSSHFLYIVLIFFPIGTNPLTFAMVYSAWQDAYILLFVHRCFLLLECDYLDCCIANTLFIIPSLSGKLEALFFVAATDVELIQ